MSKLVQFTIYSSIKDEYPVLVRRKDIRKIEEAGSFRRLLLRVNKDTSVTLTIKESFNECTKLWRGK